jgi:hypothetical protein
MMSKQRVSRTFTSHKPRQCNEAQALTIDVDIACDASSISGYTCLTISIAVVVVSEEHVTRKEGGDVEVVQR